MKLRLPNPEEIKNLQGVTTNYDLYYQGPQSSLQGFFKLISIIISINSPQHQHQQNIITALLFYSSSQKSAAPLLSLMRRLTRATNSTLIHTNSTSLRCTSLYNRPTPPMRDYHQS